MTTTAVTLPPSLAFLVSNFHALVNVKLDGGNYLLWRIQVENVMRANGYFDYLEGTVECPPAQIQNTAGVLGPNSAHTLWKLIDSQLLSCLTASLSQTTLPYVLGLTSTQRVWESLSNRYNSLSRNHVQELKNRLYCHTKLTTMEAYIDTIKDYAQKLAAAGSPLDEDDLLFHTMRGLPKSFNGFKTAVRTRGDTINFEELVTMLKGEDLQLQQESEVDTTTVLVANHSNQSQGSNSGGSSMSQPMSSSTSSFGQPQMFPSQSYGSSQMFSSQLNGPSQFGFPSSQAQFMPQPYFSQSRNFSRGRGRGPRSPCDICGRNNHSTNFCYYKTQQPFDYSSLQWRGSYPTNPSWGPNPPWIPMFQTGQSFSGIPMFQPGQSSSGSFSGIPMIQPRQSFNFRPSASSVPHLGYPSGSGEYSGFGGRPGVSSQPHPQANLAEFSGSFAMPMTYTGSNYGSMGNSVGMPSQVSGHHSSATTSSATHPWYFDSGATNHITNNLHNIEQPQPVHNSPGVMVGNGSNLQVSHAGQDNSQSSISGAMSPRPLPFTELL